MWWLAISCLTIGAIVAATWALIAAARFVGILLDAIDPE